MTPSHEELEALFAAASALETEAEQAACLDRAGVDDATRREVASLLAAHRNPDRLFTANPRRVAPGEPEGVGSRVGRYRLLEELGEGGCGVVFLAEQLEPVRRQVALKVIKLGMDTRAVVTRFEVERQALALMDHPNIARVLDAGATAAGRPYFVMELVRGVPLTAYCERRNLPVRERLALFIRVCQAIQHAHQKGIIHRDIKPSNILVTAADGVPVPKVIDFGIAKATTDQRLTDRTLFTALELFVGTPAYMSPEQAGAGGLDIDTRSDIYSLGVLLYELLAGETPFDGKLLLASGVEEMRRTILGKEPLRPSTRLLQRHRARKETGPALRPPVLASDLDWIVMKALEKDRTRRYETANGLAADLERHLNHEPVVARPPSAAYRFRKAWRRNKLVFGAAALVTAALVLGLAASSWQMVAARRARNGEQEQRLEAQAARRRADAEAGKALASREQAQRLLYTSDISVAHQALRVNHLGRARRLLDRHRPEPGETDLRGWEWRYLWQLIRDSALVTLTHRPARGTAVGFSPDGTRLAVGWSGGRVDLWDVPTRRWLRDLTAGESRHQQGRVAFSPVRNLLAATAGPDQVVLYDLDSGLETPLWRAPQPGQWDVRDVSFSPDGARVVVYAGSVEASGDAAWVIDVSTSTSTSRIEGEFRAEWSNSSLHGAARLSPDNRRLYLSRSDSVHHRYGIQCLDLATRRQVWMTRLEKDYGLTALALSPDGRVLASASGFEDPTIRIWDAATGLRLVRLEGHTGWVCELAFSKDGRRLVSAASDQSIRTWDTVDWAETKVLRGHTDEVYAVALSEPAQLAASAGKDGSLKLWKEDGRSAANGYLGLPEGLGPGEVAALDDARILLLPPDRWPERVSLQGNPSPVPLPEAGLPGRVLGFFGTDTLCRWSESGEILVHRWHGGEFVPAGAIPMDPRARPTEFAYHPGRRLAAWCDAASPTTIHLASADRAGPRTEIRSDLPWLTLLRFSEDGRHLAATARHDHSLRVWNLDTGRQAAALDERVRAVSFAADGQVLVAAIERGNDHDIGFFDLRRPEPVPRRIPGSNLCSSLTTSPDGRSVASATAGGLVRLFDPLEGRLVDVLHGHLNGAHAVAFSPDGRRLISTSSGREAVKLWDVATRMELLTLAGTGSGLEAARWSADGDVILAGAPWQAWRAPSWQEIAETEAREKSGPTRVDP